MRSSESLYYTGVVNQLVQIREGTHSDHHDVGDFRRRRGGTPGDSLLVRGISGQGTGQ